MPIKRTGKPRLLILVVAYNAKKNIQVVLARVPHQLADEYEVEVLVLDDSSGDHTFEKTREAQLGEAARRDAIDKHMWRAHVRRTLDAIEARTRTGVA